MLTIRRIETFVDVQMKFLGEELNRFNFPKVGCLATMSTSSCFESIDLARRRPPGVMIVTELRCQKGRTFKSMIIAMAAQISLFTMPNQHNRRLTAIVRFGMSIVCLCSILAIASMVDGSSGGVWCHDRLDKGSIGNALGSHSSKSQCGEILNPFGIQYSRRQNQYRRQGNNDGKKVTGSNFGMMKPFPCGCIRFLFDPSMIDTVAGGVVAGGTVVIALVVLPRSGCGTLLVWMFLWLL
jgi:hypothetical protein